MAAVAMQLRRLFGPMGGALRRVVLAATQAGEKSKDTSDTDDFAGRAAYRMAGKSTTKKDSTGGRKRRVGKVRGGRGNFEWY